MSDFNENEFKEAIDRKSKKFTEEDLEKILEKEKILEEKFKTHKGLARIWEDFKLLFGIIKDYVNGDYKEIPWWSIVAIGVTLLYVINPLDLIPDVIPIVGYVDDATVVAICLKLIDKDLQKYKEWKMKNS